MPTAPRFAPPKTAPFSDWIGLRLIDGKSHSAWLIEPSAIELSLSSLPVLLRSSMNPVSIAQSIALGVKNAFERENPDASRAHFWPDRYEEGQAHGVAWATLKVGSNRSCGWGPATSRRFIASAIAHSFPAAVAFLDMLQGELPFSIATRHAFMSALRDRAIAVHEARQLASAAPLSLLPPPSAKTRL